jgi:hypothetical protein
LPQLPQIEPENAVEILLFVERSLIHHQKLSLNIDFLFEERADDVRASAWNAQLGLAGVSRYLRTNRREKRSGTPCAPPAAQVYDQSKGVANSQVNAGSKL